MNKQDEEKRLKLVDITVADLPQAEMTEVTTRHYADDEVGPGKSITLHFALSLADMPEGDAMIEDNFGRAPASCDIGDGNLLPGFERAIFGLRAGAEASLSLPASEAFGLYNEANVQEYPRFQFPAELVLEKGLMINFADVGGNQQAGVIRDFDSTRVIVDFNHPLAGRDILFRVKILSVTAGKV